MRLRDAENGPARRLVRCLRFAMLCCRPDKVDVLVRFFLTEIAAANSRDTRDPS